MDRMACWLGVGSLLAAWLALALPLDGGEPTKKPLLIDSHMHVWSGDLVRFPFAHPYDAKFKAPKTAATVELLVDEMDKHGIAHCVLVQTICHGWDNSYLAACVKAHPKRFAGQGLIDPTADDVAEKLEFWVKRHGLAGMRFSPMYYKGKDEWLNAKATDAVWKKAAELGTVFNFFIGADQLPKLEDMVRRHPKVKVVVDHVGRCDLESATHEQDVKNLLALARYPRVYVKISELTSLSVTKKYPFQDTHATVKKVYDAFGPDRLLWGTGFPGATRAEADRPTCTQELDIIRKGLPFLTASDREKILGKNAVKVWGFAVGE